MHEHQVQFIGGTPQFLRCGCRQAKVAVLVIGLARFRQAVTAHGPHKGTFGCVLGIQPRLEMLAKARREAAVELVKLRAGRRHFFRMARIRALDHPAFYH